MLTTIAALVIVLGLMVSLTRHVRAQSAESLTQDVLRKLDRLMAQYNALHGGYPQVASLIPPHPATGPRGGLAGVLPDEVALQRNARQNNQDFMLALLGPDGLGNRAMAELSDLPISVYEPGTPSLRDAWGSPIVFMPSMHPAIGMAPGGKPFFFSAGPDRRFLSRTDNLYSYEAPSDSRGEPGNEVRSDAAGR